jgi:Tat protein translocase TatB subunit
MNLGFPEMLFIFVLALLVFGPKKLPEIARRIGKTLAEVKRISNEFQGQLHEGIRKLEHEADDKSVMGPAAPVSISNKPQLSQSESADPAEVRLLEPEDSETTAAPEDRPHP